MSDGGKVNYPGLDPGPGPGPGLCLGPGPGPGPRLGPECKRV